MKLRRIKFFHSLSLSTYVPIFIAGNFTKGIGHSSFRKWKCNLPRFRCAQCDKTILHWRIKYFMHRTATRVDIIYSLFSICECTRFFFNYVEIYMTRWHWYGWIWFSMMLLSLVFIILLLKCKTTQSYTRKKKWCNTLEQFK